jgi:putative membrane protein
MQPMTGPQMVEEHSALPYCGTAPAPGEIWHRWNFDPVLIATLMIALGGYLIASRARRQDVVSQNSMQRDSFIAGWFVGTIALMSPLCALSVSLFSARVGQHMILALVAAPLVVLGRPGTVYARLAPSLAAWLSSTRLSRLCTSAPGAAMLFAALLWFWHAPGPYAATFRSAATYWLMHVSLFAGALLVWSVVLARSPRGAIAALALGTFSTLQMTFLGALITIARRALYMPHATTTASWGLTPLTDQQLGGAIMWVPACTLFAFATVFTLARVLRDAGQPQPLPSR